MGRRQTPAFVLQVAGQVSREREVPPWCRGGAEMLRHRKGEQRIHVSSGSPFALKLRTGRSCRWTGTVFGIFPPSKGKLHEARGWCLVHFLFLAPRVRSQRRQWHPTPVLLPGKSHGQKSLVGCSPLGPKSQSRLSDFTFTFTFMHWRRKWQPTPVFLPGESQGRGSLVGCCLWGRTEWDTTEVT